MKWQKYYKVLFFLGMCGLFYFYLGLNDPLAIRLKEVNVIMLIFSAACAAKGIYDIIWSKK